MVNKFFVLMLMLSVGVFVHEGASAADGGRGCSPIGPDNMGILKWIDDFEKAPKAYIDLSIDLGDTPGSFSLLSHLTYNPVERDQGSCGNGWAWAGTGIVEIALDIQEKIPDRLSVQFINSCYPSVGCCGSGSLEDFTSFYATEGIVVPWTNANANWQDGNGSCNTLCGSIGTWPNYGIDAIVSESILTHGIGQAQAIHNIKNVLHQNRAVLFSWFFPTQADKIEFGEFWNEESEDVTGTLDYCCGKT